MRPSLQAADPSDSVASTVVGPPLLTVDDLLLGHLGLSVMCPAGTGRVGYLAPQRRSSEEELEVHGEVVELLLLRVAHDRRRLLVALDRQPLRVPADRLGLLDQRRADARVRPHLLRQLTGWLVVLVGAHDEGDSKSSSRFVQGPAGTLARVGGHPYPAEG